MTCTLKGNFMETREGHRKDGSTYVQALIYSDGETIAVNDLSTGNFKKFQEVSIPVQVRSTQYGLYVKAITENSVS